MTLRIVFMGTPEFSVPTLSELVAAGHDVVAVYSQPPRAAGRRGLEQKKSPVHEFADTCGIPVHTPTSLKGVEAQEAFAAHDADVAVVVAYGLLLPSRILNAPRYGCLNLHASTLPRWRGAAPIQRAIIAGDTTTSLMVMQMEEGLDTGPVCLAEAVTIGTNMTAGELHDELAGRGGDLMNRALAALVKGALTSTVQSEDGVTYAGKISKSETRINFNQPALDVHNTIRGLSPFPGAWFEAKGPTGKMERIKVLASELVGDLKGGPAGSVLDDNLTIACASGAVRLVRLQRAGKKPASVSDFLRGFTLTPGTNVGC
ncbi:MAG: methionyl-tRNA formyltransferase [Hyphomicrobiaceae bacterium]